MRRELLPSLAPNCHTLINSCRYYCEVIRFKFLGKANLWPRFNSTNFEAFFNNISVPQDNITFQEMLGKAKQDNPKSNNETIQIASPLIFALGKLRGSLLSIRLCEYAFRDNLRFTTKLGNSWTVISFLVTLSFFALIIVLSGGANPNLTTLDIIEIFGAWLILELAFVRGIFSSFKYGQLESRLGIDLKLIVMGMFSTVWMEFFTLLIALNAWSILNYSQLIEFRSYIGLVLCLLSLLILGYPFSYFISKISHKYIDMRFVVPVGFRFIIFSTPLFYSFHVNYPVINQILDYSPLNLSFNLLQYWNSWHEDDFLHYIVFLLASYCLLFYKRNLQNQSYWIEIG